MGSLSYDVIFGQSTPMWDIRQTESNNDVSVNRRIHRKINALSNTMCPLQAF